MGENILQYPVEKGKVAARGLISPHAVITKGTKEYFLI